MSFQMHTTTQLANLPIQALEGNLLLVGDTPEWLDAVGQRIQKVLPKLQVFACSSKQARADLELHKADVMLARIHKAELKTAKDFLELRKSFPSLKIILLAPFIEEVERELPNRVGHVRCLKEGETEHVFSTLVELLAPEHQANMMGSLSEGELIDIIQLVSTKKESCVIEVELGLYYGELWFDEGTLRHASLFFYDLVQRDQVIGLRHTVLWSEDALFALLAWKHCCFWLRECPQSYVVKKEQNIDKPWEFLVIENARLADERREDERKNPSAAQKTANEAVADLFGFSSPEEIDRILEPFSPKQSAEPKRSLSLLELDDAVEQLIYQAEELNENETPSPLSTHDQKDTSMTPLNQLQKDNPSFHNIIETDAYGSIEQSVGSGDGETLAAMSFYTLQSLEEVGDLLGLGGLAEVGLEGKDELWTISKIKNRFITCYGKPQKGPLPRQLDKLRNELK